MSPWRAYDTALTQLLKDRVRLVKPKPDFALGLQLDLTTFKRLLDWPDISVPSVDPFVHPKLAVPFFIFESRTTRGLFDTGENELANAMVQAHDVMTSLATATQQPLHVFGMLQFGFVIYIYISFGNRVIDADNKSYCDSVSHDRV